MYQKPVTFFDHPVRKGAQQQQQGAGGRLTEMKWKWVMALSLYSAVYYTLLHNCCRYNDDDDDERAKGEREGGEGKKSLIDQRRNKEQREKETFTAARGGILCVCVMQCVCVPPWLFRKGQLNTCSNKIEASFQNLCTLIADQLIKSNHLQYIPNT